MYSTEIALSFLYRRVIRSALDNNLQCRPADEEHEDLAMPEINFFWEPLSDNILQERDEFGALTAEYTTEPGLYGNVISQNRSGVESQFHFDAIGSALALTDGNQQVTDSRGYSAFGESAQTTDSTTFYFQYLGQHGYYNEGSNRYSVRRREYTPLISRWISADPRRRWMPHVSCYAYTFNSPVILADPSGLVPIVGLGTCAVPTPGLPYVPRGAFTASLSDYDRSDDWIWWSGFKIGSSFSATYDTGVKYIYDPIYESEIVRIDNPFVDAAGCCCCTRVGLIQVHRSKSKYRLFTLPLGTEIFRWGDFGGIDKGVPYPHSTQARPCGVKSEVVRATMSDMPNGVVLTILQWTLISLRQEFEVCAVCLQGKEYAAHNAFVVYGCIKWGHFIELTFGDPSRHPYDEKEEAPGYTYTRYIEGTTTTFYQSLDVEFDDSHDIGVMGINSPPSNDWLRAIKGT